MSQQPDVYLEPKWLRWLLLSLVILGLLGALAWPPNLLLWLLVLLGCGSAVINRAGQ